MKLALLWKAAETADRTARYAGCANAFTMRMPVD